MQNIKYSFGSDYLEGCHPNILDNMQQINHTQQHGYGEDDYSIEARNILYKELNTEKSSIYFVAGGTLANIIIASACLRPHEAVISASTGHINTHEAGAIESVGHKIIAVETDNGKLTVFDIQSELDKHTLGPHVVRPRMVYISNSTELGTVYSRKELKKLYDFCKLNNLILFADGARLGAALCTKDNDLAMEDMVSYTDIFYIGGTKNGAMLGEAIVINNENLKYDFDFYIKQKGALLSKGSLLGIQFLTLFTDKLFYKLAYHANAMAERITTALSNNGVKFLVESKTNQIFPILPDSIIDDLMHDYGFYIWEQVDKESSAIRLVCSWATPEDIVDEFIDDLLKLINK